MSNVQLLLTLGKLFRLGLVELTQKEYGKNKILGS